MQELTSIEVCAGAGGQALGLEQAGFRHLACVEIDSDACATLRLNRPRWRVVEDDLRAVVADQTLGRYRGSCDLLAGGVPCPPFSIAGKQLGADDNRDLFPTILELASQIQPRVLLVENVRGLLSQRFDAYRANVVAQLMARGFRVVQWGTVEAFRYGVPQLRPRAVLVAVRLDVEVGEWDFARGTRERVTVGDALRSEMAADGWKGADAWAARAQNIGPTLVGGSRKHGGPDLGPTRAKREWLSLGVDGKGIADARPAADAALDHVPRLTTAMCAALQGFPSSWRFAGRKTSRYRQIGNAFPPPVARGIALQARGVLEAADRWSVRAA